MWPLQVPLGILWNCPRAASVLLGQPLPNIMTYSSLNLELFPDHETEVCHKAQEIIHSPWQRTDFGQLDASYNAEEIFCFQYG